MEYQKQITAKLVSNRRGILAADTGTGKTKMLLDALIKDGATEALIICPAFLVSNWRAEAEKWGCQAELRVMSYDGFRRYYKTVKAYSHVIVDEAHFVRTLNALRTKALKEYVLRYNPSFLWFATATPVIKSADNMYSILRMLKPDSFKSVGKFREMFCFKKVNRFSFSGYEYYGCKDNFRPFIEENFNLITLPKETVLNLPEKRYESIRIDVPAKHYLNNLKLSVDEVVKKLEEGGGTGDHIATVRRELGLAKVPVCIEFIKSKIEDARLFDEGRSNNVVIWCHHIEVAELLKQKMPIDYLITGATSMAKRQEVVEAFQSEKNKTLVCTIGAMGVGVTLTSSSLMFFIEKPYLYADLKQAEDRLHRIGQDRNIDIFSFVANKTIDEGIEKVLRLRKGMHNDFVF